MTVPLRKAVQCVSVFICIVFISSSSLLSYCMPLSACANHTSCSGHLDCSQLLQIKLLGTFECDSLWGHVVIALGEMPSFVIQ